MSTPTEIFRRLPFWAKFAGFIVLASVILYGIGSLMESPERRAIADCVTKLNKAAQGTLRRSQLEQTCILMQQRGQL